MSVSSEFVLGPILTGRKGNEPDPNEESQSQSQPMKKQEEEREEGCETPKGEHSRIVVSLPDPPRKRRCVVISKRTISSIEVIAVEKEELDRLFVRRDSVGCGLSVKPGSKRKWCSVQRRLRSRFCCDFLTILGGVVLSSLYF